MTFLEAAIEILRQAGRPLNVKEITERAIKQNLLTVLGRTPETTMQSRLTQETKKGDRTPFIKSTSGTFGLARYDRPALPPAPAAAEPSVPAPAERAASDGAGDEAAAAEKKGRRRRRGGRRRGKGEAPEVEGAPKVGGDPEEGTPEEALAAAELAGDTEATDQFVIARVLADAQAASESPPGIDLDSFAPRSTQRKVVMNAEMGDETALAEAYADEMGEPARVADAGEIVDAKSADEDRPMLAEITGGRGDRDRRGRRRHGGRDKQRDQDRPQAAKGEKAEARKAPAPSPEPRKTDQPRAERGKRGRRDRREERQPREERAARQQPQPQAGPQPAPYQAQRQESPQPGPQAQIAPRPADLGAPAPAATSAGTSVAAESGGLADIAFGLLRSLNDPRPIHARQIVAMALKRKIVTGDAEELFRVFRAALLDDARARQGRGLRPRVRHHGGALFAIATSRLDAELARAEEALAVRAVELGDETRAALRRRLAELPGGAFDQLTRVFLERTGWRDVQQVKRVEQTTYLSARAKSGALPTRALIAVRAGSEDIGRRAVGELRAGVIAKQLDAGLLVAAGRLSQDGDREARQPGPPTTLLDGDAFADELVRAGVGVLRVAMPIAYLDADFFVELTQS